MKKNWLVLIVSFLSLMVLPLTALADEQPTINYSVEAILPDNQQDTSKSYFDLLVVPGKKQQVSIALTNTSNSPIDIAITPYTASTSSGGTINYNGKEQSFAPSLVYSFEDLISKAQTINLPANENKIVTFDMAIPESGFTGTVLGGLYIKELKQDNKVSQINDSENQATIVNEYSFVIGVKLQTNLEPVEPNFSLKVPEIIEWNDFFSLNGTIVNDAALIISGYQIEGEVLSKKTGKVVHTIEKKDFSMAPNSNYSMAQKVNPTTFPSGEYLYKATITKGDQSWSLEKEFTISDKERQKVLEKSVNAPKESNQYLYYIIALLIGIVVLLAVLVIKRRGERRD